MTEVKPQFVLATYRVEPGKQEAFMAALRDAEAAMRTAGLITDRPALRMRSNGDPQLVLEVFEWVDEEAFGRAQETPAVLSCWGRLEALWKDGGFALREFPEASEGWAQLTALE